MTKEELKNLAILYSMDAPVWGRYVVLDAFGDLEVYSQIPKYTTGIWGKMGNTYSNNNRRTLMTTINIIVNERTAIRNSLPYSGIALQIAISEEMDKRYGIAEILIEING